MHSAAAGTLMNCSAILLNRTLNREVLFRGPIMKEANTHSSSTRHVLGLFFLQNTNIHEHARKLTSRNIRTQTPTSMFKRMLCS
jgi:hypothetical protein